MKFFRTILDKLTFRVVNKKELIAEIEENVLEAVREENKWDEGENILERMKGVKVSNSFSTSIFNYIDSGMSAKGQLVGVKEGSTDWIGLGLTPGVDPENEQTEEELRYAQSASIGQYLKLPIAKSIIENYKRYVIGRGIKFSVVVSEIEDFLKRFWIQNRFEKRGKDGFRDLLLDGEIFYSFFLFVTRDGFDKDLDTVAAVRRIPSGQITAVEYDPDDYETPLSYTRMVDSSKTEDKKHYLDIDHPDSEAVGGLAIYKNSTKSEYIGKAEEERVMMVKNGLTFDRRGRVFMDSVLRWNRIFSDFTFDRGRINHLRTKVWLIKTVTSKSGTASIDSYKAMPKGGTMLIETADRKYRMDAPNTGASDAKEDAKLLLHMIAAGVSMPDHILVQDASNNNYASIREAGTPFVQAVLDMQDDFAEAIRSMLRYILRVGVKYEILKPEYTIEIYPGDMIGEAKAFISDELDKGSMTIREITEAAKTMLPTKKRYKIWTVEIPIEIIFPEIVSVDPDKQANVIKIYREIGLWSRKTAIQKTGEDPDIEIPRIEMEEEEQNAKNDERFNKRNNDYPPDRGDEPPDEPDEDEPDDKDKPEDKKEGFAGLFPEYSVYIDIDESSINDPTNAERQARYRQNNDAKVKARNKLHSRITSGKIKKPKACQNCGKVTSKLHAHHASYSKPTSVRWLCRKCEVHADNKKLGRKKDKIK